MENKQIAETKTPIPMAFKIWYIAESRKEPISEAFKEWKSRGQQLCYEVAYTEGYQDAAEASYEKLSQEKRATAIGFAEWKDRVIYWNKSAGEYLYKDNDVIAPSIPELYDLYIKSVTTPLNSKDMREIRFNAFDTRYGVMLENVTVYASGDHLGITLEEAEKYYSQDVLESTDNHLYGGDDWIFIMNEFILLQFTGYKDDNDTEVYEGDIVEVEYGKGIVVFEASCFMIQWIDDAEANMELLSRTSKMKVRESLKIIGNIYSNPELLTPAK